MVLRSLGRRFLRSQSHLKTKEKFFSFSIKLTIRGEMLDFETITTRLGISPTHTYKCNGFEEDEKQDAWYYMLKGEGTEKIEAVARDFFNAISGAHFALEQVPSASAEVNLHIHSDLAQIYFEVPQNLLCDLVQCRIPFGISVLSWGMVWDEDRARPDAQGEGSPVQYGKS